MKVAKMESERAPRDQRDALRQKLEEKQVTQAEEVRGDVTLV